MLRTESRQVRRARTRALVRGVMTKAERRSLFRRATIEKRDVVAALLHMIAGGQLKPRS